MFDQLMTADAPVAAGPLNAENAQSFALLAQHLGVPFDAVPPKNLAQQIEEMEVGTPPAQSACSPTTSSSVLTPAQPVPLDFFSASRQPSAMNTPGSWRGTPHEDWGSSFEEVFDPNEGRFRREFCDITAVGKGQFSTVYKARNRIDQHWYAVKEPLQQGRGSDAHASLREVFVLAKIAAGSTSEHLVDYFASWEEDGLLYIQLELCAGSLRARLHERVECPQLLDPRFAESDLVILTRQVSRGLARLHELGFAHLDVKPDNILTKEASQATGEVNYKVADLGHVTAAEAAGGFVDTTEGDRRYVAKELLRGANVDLPKADVFSLGLVCYEAATNPTELPCGGDAWHSLREGQFDETLLPPLSEPMLGLLRRMVGAPQQRPTCAEIAQQNLIAEATDEVQALRLALQEAQKAAEQNLLLAEKYLALERQGLALPAQSIDCTPLGG